MRILFLTLLLLLSADCYAQEAGVTYDYQQAPATETQEPIAEESFEPSEPAMPVVAPIASAPPASVAPVPTYEKKKFAVLQTLDKLTARTAAITVPVGQATAIGPLFVDIKTCQKTPPTEQPESSAFMQIWEAKPKPKLKKRIQKDANEPPSQWVFSGWMFASSPALSAMDHPIYDVWLKDCVNTTASAKQK